MQNHQARVALAACLAAATAAAQAPSTFDGFDAAGSGLRKAVAEPAGSGFGSGLRTAQLDATGPRTSLGAQDPDYSLRGMFLDQHGDFLAKRERYNPQIEFTGRYQPNQRINHEPGSFDVLGYGFDADVPLLVSTDGFLQLGAYYQARNYQHSTATTLDDETIIGTGAKFGFGAFLDENWLLEFQVRPGLWSDLDGGTHSDDFDMPGHVLFTARTIDNFFFKFGARYNQIYEDAVWLPYLGFSWLLSESFRLDVLAPEKVEMSVWPSPSFGIMLGGEMTGAEYHVRKKGTAGQQRDDLRIQEATVYAGLAFRFTDYTSLIVRGGAVIAGDYSLTTGATGFDRVDGMMDPGAFVEVTFGIDF